MKVQENTVKKHNIFKTFVSSSEFRVLVPLLAIILITTAFKPTFMSVTNFVSLYTTIPFIAIIALGASFTLMTGNVDISTGRVAGLGGIMVALFISVNGMPWYVAMVLSLLVCAVIGIVNGIMVVKLNVPDFVATMATLNICGAVRYLILPKGIIDIDLKQYENLWVGDLSSKPLLGMPFQFWAMVVIFIIAYIVIKKTKWGKRLLACGDNREVAAMSGIKVTKMRMVSYIICAVLAGVCGIVTTIAYNIGYPAIGDGWEFKAIAGCVVGGVSLAGGKGSPIGVFLGVSLVFIAENAIIFFGLPTVLKSAVQGVVMAAAVMYETILERKKIKA